LWDLLSGERTLCPWTLWSGIDVLTEVSIMMSATSSQLGQVGEAIQPFGAMREATEVNMFNLSVIIIIIKRI